VVRIGASKSRDQVTNPLRVVRLRLVWKKSNEYVFMPFCRQMWRRRAENTSMYDIAILPGRCRTNMPGRAMGDQPESKVKKMQVGFFFLFFEFFCQSMKLCECVRGVCCQHGEKTPTLANSIAWC
jgi:hypothetical protein